MKGFIEVVDTSGNALLVNVNEIQILWCDSRIQIKGLNKEIPLEEHYEEVRQLIKEATEL